MLSVNASLCNVPKTTYVHDCVAVCVCVCEDVYLPGCVY